MKYEMFQKFVAFMYDQDDPRWAGKKITILGGYALRIGSEVYEYDWQRDTILRVK